MKRLYYNLHLKGMLLLPRNIIKFSYVYSRIVLRKKRCGILINDLLPLPLCEDWEIWEIEHVWLFYFTTEDAT